MVVLRFEPESDILGRYAIRQDIMSSLNVEGLFHLCERGDVEMEEYEEREDDYGRLPKLDSGHGLGWSFVEAVL